jgi:hypothetical protein
MSATDSTVESGTGVIFIPGDRYFPEGVTVTEGGTFFVGSMEEGCIMKVPPGAKEAEPFIGFHKLLSQLQA